MYCNKFLIGWLLFGWLLMYSVTVNAANFSKAELNDEQFLLLDIKNKDLLFLEAIDAYGLDRQDEEQDKEKQVLLPIASLLQALEMNFMVSTENATIKLTRGKIVFDIDLLSGGQRLKS